MRAARTLVTLAARRFAAVARAASARRFASASDAWDELQRRGLVFQHTANGIDEALRAQRIVAYAGFDPTADSLHVGHLAVLNALRVLEAHGHSVIGLVGGATGRIGDPSGRASPRVALADDVVAANGAEMARQMRKFGCSQLVDNRAWWDPMPFMAFVGGIASRMRVTTMLSRHMVKERASGLALSELLYQALQAFDFEHLHAQFGCTLQVGGSDQWGNIVGGVDLLSSRGVQGHAFTVPLVTNNGRKIGKSAGNAVWLDARRTSPFALHQYLWNVSDADAPRLLLQLSPAPLAELEATLAKAPAAAEARFVQRALADAVVSHVHGADALSAVYAGQKALFDGSGSDDSLSVPQLARAAAESGAQTRDVSRAELDALDAGASSTPAALLAAWCGVPSRREAKRLLESGAVQWNRAPLSGASLPGGAAALFVDGWALIRIGKKRHVVLRLLEG